MDNNDHNSQHLQSDHIDLQENFTVSIIIQLGLNQDDVIQEIEIYEKYNKVKLNASLG